VNIIKQLITRRDDMTPADRGGSTSVRGRICSPHSCGGLHGSRGAAVARLGRVGQTDRQTDASWHRLMPPTAAGA